MLLSKRETEIVAMVNRRGGSKVKTLASHFGVTEATIRRDLRKLEELSLLKRVHGGAISLENGSIAAVTDDTFTTMDQTDTDALILAPVQSRTAHTLRERALRNRFPFIAESCRQDGAIYLGPDNFEATKRLGGWTGECFLRQFGATATAHVLDITEMSLPNTRERSAGFAEGIASVLGDRLKVYSIDGKGMYNDACQVTRDALQFHPEINVIFGVNDDSVLAGLHSYADLGRDPEQLIAVDVGGEGKTILDILMQGGPLKACLAMFPDVVGQLAIDATVRLWEGEDIGDEIITPCEVLTKDNLKTYYRWTGKHWALLPERLAELLPPGWSTAASGQYDRTITFVFLYRSHEWYQSLAQVMRMRAGEHGITFVIKDPKDDLRDEIRELRQLIGKMAASYVDDGDTIILDGGATTNFLTQFLHGHSKFTAITNSSDIFLRLQTFPNIELIVTGGKFDPNTHSFMGRGAQLFLQDIRADKVFIVAEGISPDFGISSATETKAELQRLMMRAAREVIVLADHTVLDAESNFHVAGLDAIDTLITDVGILASQSLELARHNIKTLVVGGMNASESAGE